MSNLEPTLAVHKMAKQLSAICPECRKKVEFAFDSDVIDHAPYYPVACSIKHCDKTIVVYIDANYKVRGTTAAHDLSNNPDGNPPYTPAHDSIPIAAFAQPSIERRTIYTCLAGCEAMLCDSIPNILEKHLLRHIYEKKKVSLAILSELVKGLEKATNMAIDNVLVKRLLQKYVAKGIISESIIEAG